MDRPLRDIPLTLERKVKDSAQNLVDVDTGSMAVAIYDSAGVLVTNGDATRISLGVYQFVVASSLTAVLDEYEVRWQWQQSGVRKATSYYEVVGAHYCSLSDLRDADQRLEDTTQYPDQKVVNAREKAEEFIEKKTHRSWVPRGARVTLNGTGGRDIALNYDHIPIRSVVSASITSGTTDTFDATELADLSISETGFLTRKTLGSWTSGYRNVSLFYEYGENQPPEDIKEAAMLLAQNKLIPTDIQAGVKQLSVEGYSLTYRDGLISNVPGVHELLEPYVQNYAAIA